MIPSLTSILLDKPFNCEINRVILCWVMNWLYSRPQRAVEGLQLAGGPSSTTSAPQGLVLGPVLLNIVINDLDVRVECILCKTADDASLGLAVDSLE